MFGTWHRHRYMRANIRPCVGHGNGILPFYMRLIGYPFIFPTGSTGNLKIIS
ncbi:hypothetical protein F383_28468 [Gossypium arboreum]|uniref:Uncharacterized protein n=1 Tax=Gossypium arboreum TaxID=29729 RepID=A0A0B0MYM1_GOSAR|nr:hypothetical protein F383_28468 [Gossypium arboreum]